MAPIKVIILGAGNRGTVYASYASNFPEQMQVVGVAEPRADFRDRMAQAHHIPPRNVCADWRELAERPRFADAAVIATPDQLHTAPALALVERGYHILLEKPMAVTETDCRQITAAAQQHGIIFGVAHVMRYTRYTRKLKEILDSGAIGELVSLQHLEPVGYWHQAHSYVRGNWRNAESSTFMLLAKSCHDLDWMTYLMGSKCLAVSSFGSLAHFTPQNRPAGAAERCLDCAVEASCPYSAVRIYLGRVQQGMLGHPVSVVAAAPTPESVTQALREGPYGRCVYACDNDVVDHQVVNLLFTGGRTADFTMTGFTRYADRQTRLFGTRGEISGDGREIRIFDFLTERTTLIDAAPVPGPLSAHGGGDLGLMQNFVAAVAQNNPRLISSTPEEILNSHLIAFAAEKARLEKRVVEV